MKRIRGYVVFLFILAMLVVPSRTFAFLGLDIGVSYWRPTSSGTMEYNKPVTNYSSIDPNAAYTSNIDLKNDLHLGSENKLFARIKAELPLILPNIYLMATPITFEGSGPLTRGISFGDSAFYTDIPVESKIKLDHYDLALFYTIPMFKTGTTGVLNVELGINARKYDFEGTISTIPTTAFISPNQDRTAAKSCSFYVPMIYGGIQIKPVSSFSIEAEIRYIAYSSSHYSDYLGRLKYNRTPLVYMAGGYRAETIKMHQSDVKANIRFGAPFIEAGLNF